ncbi:hypothetical protein NQ318_015934 [Aromia moschata]|uniref:Uncharacterized protein n=1 Tax=Aromia moschata TaxID=1265417 RepID=A0AAV8XI61_9CUCU|nr:hypothetical protein NQ318_015934 [Aromia moschata]
MAIYINKMSLNDVSLSVEEVEEALNEIENKYSLEFDSVGLPTIDLSQSLMNITKQIASSALSLVHIYRKTLSQMKDLNVEKLITEKMCNRTRKILNLALKINKENEPALSNKVIVQRIVIRAEMFNIYYAQMTASFVNVMFSKDSYTLGHKMGGIGPRGSSVNASWKVLASSLAQSVLVSQTDPSLLRIMGAAIFEESCRLLSEFAFN